MTPHQQTAALCAAQLAPLADQIDREGFYPKAFVDTLFALGALEHITADFPSLAAQYDTLAQVGRYCGTTAFSLWCHSAALWYVTQSPNQALQARYLEPIRSGALRAATGLSNTIKSLSGIEQHRLHARPQDDGFVINGDLPWVSHVDDGHVVAVTAQLDDGRLVMLLAEVDDQRVRRHDCPPFIALQGSLTVKLVFDELFVPATQVLATPEEMDAYLPRISAGMITLQLGMGDGIIRHALALLAENERYSAALNQHLPAQYSLTTLQTQYQAWAERVAALLTQTQPEFSEILQIRFDAAQLALNSSQSLAIHSGGRGFIAGQAAGRLTREATFVAIVTPTMKHLAATLAELRSAEGVGA